MQQSHNLRSSGIGCLLLLIGLTACTDNRSACVSQALEQRRKENINNGLRIGTEVKLLEFRSGGSGNPVRLTFVASDSADSDRLADGIDLDADDEPDLAFAPDSIIHQRADFLSLKVTLSNMDESGFLQIRFSGRTPVLTLHTARDANSPEIVFITDSLHRITGIGNTDENPLVAQPAGLLAGIEMRPPGSGTHIDTTTPGPVTGFVVAAADVNQLQLIWDEASDNQSTSLNLRYEICADLSSGGCNPFTVSGQSTGTTAIILTGLTNNTQYFLCIRVIDEAGNISPATEAITGNTLTGLITGFPVFTPPPSTYDGDQSIAISSATSGANICYTLNSAEPVCNAGAGCSSGSLLSSGGSVSLTATSVIKARACRMGYTPSAIISGTYVLDKSPPTPPANSLASRTNYAEITITWDPTTDDVTAPGELTYQICYSVAEDGCDVFEAVWTTGPGDSEFIHNDLSTYGTAQVTYYYYIRATDATGKTRAASAVTSVRFPGWQQEAFLKPVAFLPGLNFGSAVAASGDTVAVGVGSDDHSGSSILAGPVIPGQTQTGTSWDTGAVYIFRKTGTTWALEAYIKAASPDQSDGFGSSVSLDGDVLIASAPGEDSADTSIIYGTAYTAANDAPMPERFLFLYARDLCGHNKH